MLFLEYMKSGSHKDGSLGCAKIPFRSGTSKGIGEIQKACLVTELAILRPSAEDEENQSNRLHYYRNGWL